jgi:hypothetical protein
VTLSGCSSVDKCPPIGDHDQARSRDSGGYFTRQVRRCSLIVVAHQDERRALDRAEAGARIRPAHDRLLLTQKRFHARVFGHRADHTF